MSFQTHSASVSHLRRPDNREPLSEDVPTLRGNEESPVSSGTGEGNELELKAEGGRVCPLCESSEEAGEAGVPNVASRSLLKQRLYIKYK